MLLTVASFQHYGALNAGAFMLIRQTLLGFFQDIHIRVSFHLHADVHAECFLGFSWSCFDGVLLVNYLWKANWKTMGNLLHIINLQN